MTAERDYEAMILFRIGQARRRLALANLRLQRAQDAMLRFDLAHVLPFDPEGFTQGWPEHRVMPRNLPLWQVAIFAGEPERSWWEGQWPWEAESRRN